MLAGIYYGSMYGGSTTSILVNVPGEPASVVTTLDGYAMARKGRAGAALAIAAIASFVPEPSVSSPFTLRTRFARSALASGLRSILLCGFRRYLASNLTGIRAKSLIMIMVG